MLLIGVDVGGTFTDLVFTDTESGRTTTHKVASTPDDPSRAVLAGVEQICTIAGVDTRSIAHFFHGTTVATNAALQYRGVRAGLITTHGFRDIIHIGRHQRPHHYSLQQGIPWQDQPLVLRRHRKAVTERLAPPRGEIITPLNEMEVRVAARELREAGVEAIAVCFLFAYLNPEHELRAKDLIEEECPGIFVTCSHQVAPQFREFERFTTTAMNAFIGPLVRDYVQRLQEGLVSLGFLGEIHIMRSNGGVSPPRSIAELPVSTLMSGLAAGVLGGAWIGELAGRRDIITLDIGGTSADIGVVTDGRFGEASARDTQVAGYPILMPMIDLHTIGAGGGSIARKDPGGAFRVGPQSAGAIPGPAAYGLGGDQPTVTDANLVLGRLQAGSFLGGSMSLDTKAARFAVQGLAEQLSMPMHDAAEGIIAILNSNMANAIRARTVQKGIDPRQYALVAFGGAGPLHGAEVAQMLGIPEVIVPPFPGINSAIGLLTTDLKYDAVRTAFISSSRLSIDVIQSRLEEIESEIFRQIAADGLAPDSAIIERSADARYVGQGYELRLPLPTGTYTEDAIHKAINAFHELHHREYGHNFPGSPIEIVNLRVTAVGSVPKISAAIAPGVGTPESARLTSTPVFFRTKSGLAEHQTDVFDRKKLGAGSALAGPALVLQADSTTVIPPGCRAHVHVTGSLIISVAG